MSPAFDNMQSSPKKSVNRGDGRAILAERRRNTRRQYVLGVGFPIILLIIWELSARIGLIDSRFFPYPTKIAATAISIVHAPEGLLILNDVLITVERVVFGYPIGAVAGIIVGALMGIYLPVRYAMGPLVYATFPMPKLAIFPLLLVIFGIGDSSKVALIAMGVFYMTCLNTYSGIIYASPIYRDLIKAFKLPLATAWFRVILPSALPSIMTGLKLGVGQALILVVSAEFVSSNDGIGYYIWNSWQILDISRMFVGLVVVCAIGGVSVIISNAAERYLIPWGRNR